MIEIPEGPPDDPWQKIPLTWRAVTMTEKGKVGRRSACFSCTNGHSGALFDHEIMSDGTVVPSVVCPEARCDFHEIVRLMGWTS